MTRSETLRAFEKQFKRWVYMVKYYGWKLTILYHDSVEDMPDDASYDCCAQTTANFKYLEAVIHVNLKKCATLTEAEIEYIVIHELVHPLVSPLRESSETTPLEYTVTSLARIMQGLRNEWK